MNSKKKTKHLVKQKFSCVKVTTVWITVCSLCTVTQQIKDFLNNRPKNVLCFPSCVQFCKVNIMLFSSLLDMITESLSRWVGGRWVGGSVDKWSVVGWSVGRWSVDLIKPLKNIILVILFSYFKGITYAYLLKISITHQKK